MQRHINLLMPVCHPQRAKFSMMTARMEYRPPQRHNYI